MRILTGITLVCLMSISVLAGQSIDDATLSRYVRNNFVADESMSWEKIDGFKDRFSVTDDQLYRVLMGIYREAEDKRLSLTPKTPEWNNNNRKIEGVLGWLPKCGDIPVKEFLMSYATTKENDSWLRGIAILSYLREADAEEAKNAFLRFLVEGDRLGYMERLSLYEYARMIYNEATTDKKMAILDVLHIAVSDPNLAPWEFRVCDDILAQLSPIYAQSYQRFLLLKKHNAFNYPEKRMTTKGMLAKRLEEMDKLKNFYSISTNFTALKSQKLDLPVTGGTTNKLSISSPDFVPLEQIKNVGRQKSYPLFWVGLSITALVFAVFCFSLFARSRQTHR